MKKKKNKAFDDYIKNLNEIVEKIEYAIEQHPSFLKVIPEQAIAEMEDLNKTRQWEY